MGRVENEFTSELQEFAQLTEFPKHLTTDMKVFSSSKRWSLSALSYSVAFKTTITPTKSDRQ